MVNLFDYSTMPSYNLEHDGRIGLKIGLRCAIWDTNERDFR